MSDNITSDRYFPEEVVEQLLSWLPPVTLIRCYAVCKMWNEIFHETDFLKYHRRRSHNHPIGKPRRYIRSPQPSNNEIFNNRYTIHIDDASLRIDQEFVFQFNFTYYPDVIGCSNGVFLISEVDYKTVKLVLWNPSLRRYSQIPCKELEQCLKGAEQIVLGLYYLASVDDYRVIVIVYEFFNAPTALIVRLFSVNSQTWVDYEMPVPRYFLESTLSQVIVNDALHWFGRDVSGPNMIVAFKFDEEVFFTIPLPSAVLNHSVIEPIQLNTRLGVYASNLKKENELWVMADYDRTESWTNIVRLKTADTIIPFAFRLTEEKFVELFHYIEENEEVVCYNCERRDSRSLDISCCDLPHMGYFTESMGLYSEIEYIVGSNEETQRSERFIADLVKLCMKSLDLMLSIEEHSVAVLPDPASKTLTIRNNGTGLAERDLFNFLDIQGVFGSNEEDEVMVLFGDLQHLLHKVIFSTVENQYIMEAQPGETFLLRKDTGGEVLAKGTMVVVHFNDDQASYLDERVLRTVLNDYLSNTGHAFHVGHSVDD